MKSGFGKFYVKTDSKHPFEQYPKHASGSVDRKLKIDMWCQETKISLKNTFLGLFQNNFARKQNFLVAEHIKILPGNVELKKIRINKTHYFLPD